VLHHIRNPLPPSSFLRHSSSPAVSFSILSSRLPRHILAPRTEIITIDLIMTTKILLLLQLTLTLLSSPVSLVSAFTMSSTPTGRHPHCELPGDPSLILQTNVDLGDKKAQILKDLSALVAKSLGKPESYVGE
jgi:hypothetical protein